MECQRGLSTTLGSRLLSGGPLATSGRDDVCLVLSHSYDPDKTCTKFLETEHWFSVQRQRCSLSELADRKRISQVFFSLHYLSKRNHFTCGFLELFWHLTPSSWRWREDHPFVVSFGSFWFCSRWRWSLSQLLLCVYKKGRLAFVDRESQELKPPFHRLQWQKHPHVPPEPGFNSVLENSLWDFLNPEQSWHSFFSTSGFKCFSFFQPFIISVLTF